MSGFPQLFTISTNYLSFHLSFSARKITFNFIYSKDCLSWPICAFPRIQRMTTVLNEKEDSLRKLKETLRKAQQQGEESCKMALFFWDLYERLNNRYTLTGRQKKTLLLEMLFPYQYVEQLWDWNCDTRLWFLKTDPLSQSSACQVFARHSTSLIVESPTY